MELNKGRDRSTEELDRETGEEQTTGHVERLADDRREQQSYVRRAGGYEGGQG